MILLETRIKNMKRGKLCELYILCALLCTVAFVNGSELFTTNLFKPYLIQQHHRSIPYMD